VRALDVSGGGLAIRLELTIPLGDIVEVYFELPIGFAVEARAEVVRSEPGATALRFVGLDREALVALRSYCRISGIQRLESQPAPASR
jgi:predicted Zn-dependent protease